MKKFSALATAGFLAVGFFSTASPARASLEGTFNIEPEQGGLGDVTGVIFTGFGPETTANAGSPDPLTSLDWIMPQPIADIIIPGCMTSPPNDVVPVDQELCDDFQERGGAFQSSSSPFNNSDDFEPFDGLGLLIKDLPEETAMFPSADSPPGDIDGFPTPTNTVEDFITGIDVAVTGETKGYTLDLKGLNFPQYTEIDLPGGGTGTNVALGISGHLYKLACTDEAIATDMCSNEFLEDPTKVTRTGDRPSSFFGAINFVFDVDPDTVRASVDELGEQGLSPNTYSFQITATDVVVPEGSNLIGVLGLGLVGSLSFLRKSVRR